MRVCVPLLILAAASSCTTSDPRPSEVDPAADARAEPPEDAAADATSRPAPDATAAADTRVTDATAADLRAGDTSAAADAASPDDAMADTAPTPIIPPPSGAVARGLVVQYAFREAAGAEVQDTAGNGAPMPLTIHRLVDRIPHGLRFRKPASPPDPKWGEAAYDSPLVSTTGFAKKVIDAVKASMAFTVELWLKPAELKQAGPARILAIAQSNYDGANLQITHGPGGCADGSPGQLLHIRILSAGIGGNGCPELKYPSQPNITGQLEHVVLTQDAKGLAVLYVDGKVSVMQQRAAFSPHTAWSDKAALALGNLPLATAKTPGASESNGRFWVGDLYYVGIHDSALTAEEVKQNFAIPYASR